MASKRKASVRSRQAGGSLPNGIGGLARRAVLPGLAAVAAAGLLAACGTGGTGGDSGAAVTPGAAHQVAPHGAVIATRKLPGFGAVLVDRSGKTLYSPQQEAHGNIMCTGSCLSFWFPVRVGADAILRAPSGVTGVLGTVHRSEGLTQLTYNGQPLYTFRLDQAPGQARGNNFTDHFGHTSFTWHAVAISGGLAGTGQPGNPGGYSYQGGSPGY